MLPYSDSILLRIILPFLLEKIIFAEVSNTPCMETHNTVQYPCALDENNNLVFIDDVVRETRHEHTFRCPNCGHLMRPLQGGHNTWCFAHSENQKCGVESFIHSSAKLILARRFNERKVPFRVGFSSKQSCKLKETCTLVNNCNIQIPTKYEEYNLQDSYDLPAEIEVNMLEPDGEKRFRPDVLLRSSNPKRDCIYIEVYHKSKSKEAKYNSGHQIIEIRIKDMEDLKSLETIKCFKEGPDIHFYNFKDHLLSPDKILERILQCAKENDLHCSEKYYPFCKQSPDFRRRNYHIQRFILYKSGETFRSGIFQNELNSHHPSALMDITFDTDNIQDLDPGKILAHKDIRARHCTFCDHCISNWEGTTWCNIVKNGTSRKGTFNKLKGTYCRDFKWRKNEPFFMGDERIDPVEGADYTIWINPEIQ